ncbi:carboxypeptidase C prc1 [Apophysomyces ossiformis]|uniref:Carboxypeptidase C prc1 n=1 Tax=Apophysomyces ossiformis TaxID=679940 RepID=A0A8H7EMZ8_9FUNG|nr:carboxypeptidase C prc1 [Apophysomyces ossiformis]
MRSFFYVKQLIEMSHLQISCGLRDLSRVQMVRRNEFESSVRAIHYYWKILNVTPDKNDALDVALLHTFEKVHMDLKIDDHHLAADFVEEMYYKKDMHEPLSLAADVVSTLTMKAHALRSIYNERLALYTKYLKGLRAIWEELSIPLDKRCPIRQSLDSEYMNELRTEFEKLKAVVRSMTEEYINKFKVKLENLWDKCLLTQNEREDFMNQLHEFHTMDEVRTIVDEHIQYLQDIQHDSANLSKIMKERKDIIQKMVDFEKTASDPGRLFQSSFILNEQERFRKSCFPTLLKLDKKLMHAVQKFERVSKKPFIVGERRYLDTLRDEIAARVANQTFFGFLNPDYVDTPARNMTKTQEPRIRTRPASLTSIGRNNLLKLQTSFSTRVSGSTVQLSPSSSTQARYQRNSISRSKSKQLTLPALNPSTSTKSVKRKLNVPKASPNPSISEVTKQSSYSYPETFQLRSSLSTVPRRAERQAPKRRPTSMSMPELGQSYTSVRDSSDLPTHHRRASDSKMPPTPPSELSQGSKLKAYGLSTFQKPSSVKPVRRPGKASQIPLAVSSKVV